MPNLIQNNEADRFSVYRKTSLTYNLLRSS